MRCEIQWIDKQGKPTPDTNEAVCFAVSTFDYPDGKGGTREPQKVEKFPCCAKHAEELDTLIGRGKMVAHDREMDRVIYVSQWTREEFPTMKDATANV